MNDFKRFMELYPIGERKVDSNSEYFKLLKKIELDIKNIIDEKYIIKSACGQGNLAEVPWICIFDSSITKKAEQGIYIAILFKRDMSGFYLTLNQGMQAFRDKYGMKGDEYLNKVSEYFRKNIISSVFNLPSIDLNVLKGSRGKGYEKATIIAKYYEKDNVNILELKQDIMEMLEIYEDICDELNYISYEQVISNIINNYDEELIFANREESLSNEEHIVLKKKLSEIKIPSIRRKKVSFSGSKKARKIDGVEKAKKDTETGLIGEKLVLAYEKERMVECGREDLVDKVKCVSEYNDNLGYDIISYDFDENGNEYQIYIEVKTTESSEKNEFFLTYNEKEVMKKSSDIYWIYRVSLKNGNPVFYKINYEDLISRFEIKEYSYVVKLNGGDFDE